MPRKLIRLSSVAASLWLAACDDPEARRAAAAKAAQARVSAESTVAHAAAQESPKAGAWTEALVVKRLVDAGLAPQRRDSVASQSWMRVPVHAFTLGTATVHAYIYADSASRHAAVGALDPATLAPKGAPTPWSQFRAMVENGNLVAIVDGGTDRQRDRIVTALAAGIGAP